MKHIARLLAFILVVTSFSCTTIKEVPQVVNTRILPLGDSVKIYPGSLVYALPMTAFDFTVVAEKTIRKSGPFSRYASQLLGIKDVITEDRVIWTLKEVKVKPVTELDPEQYYVIDCDGLMEINSIAMRSAGLILDINPELYGKREYYSRDLTDEEQKSMFRDMGFDEYYDIEQDTTYRLVNVDTAFVRIPYVLERRRQLTLEEQAENIARALLELREGRHMILTGEANVFPQDRSAIDEINRLEYEYMSLFAGKSYTETISFSYFFIPEKGMEGRPVILFRFSPELGVMDPSDVTGRPVVVEMISAGKATDINFINQEQPSVERFDRLYYRIPEVVNIRVTDGKRTLGNSRQLVYQFGKIVPLPANYIIRR